MTKRLKRTTAGTLLTGIVTAAALTIGAQAAYGAVVCGSTGLPVTVPATTNGVYINFVTGALSTTSNVAGWDFNVWSSSLAFFTSVGVANTNALMGDGTANGTPSVLAAGTPIGSSGTFFAGGGVVGNVSTSPWRAGVTGGYAGVRFNKEDTATTHYGWVQMNTTAPLGHPAQVIAYCWEDTPNTTIIAGTTPVSLQQFRVD